MQVGTGPGPGGAPQHQSSYYVYDIRSGVIVGTYHFVGAAPASEPDRLAAMLKTSHEVSGIPLELLAVLTNPNVPLGERELRVEHAAKQLVRKNGGSDPRVQP